VKSSEQIYRAFHLCFSFLSQVYLDSPNQEFIGNLVEEDLFSSWPLSRPSQAAAQGLDKLRLFCRQWGPSQLPELKLDYTRLFLGLDKTLAPPYESVYLGREHTLFERQTLEVREFYRLHDLRLSQDFNLPDDHLGVELHFCSLMLDRCVSVWDSRKDSDDGASKEALQQFLELHLLKWIEPFAHDVAERARTLYYQGAGSLTLGTVRDCAGFLQNPRTPGEC
jgi:TorA maturation chaperone TorD